jgi:uncharacterized surface protein with fasciclin (FAS1) repeats
MAINSSSTTTRWLVGFASIGAMTLLAACGSATDTAADTVPAQDPMVTESPAVEPDAASDGNSVVDVATSEENFSILVEAVEAAKLTDTLSDSGPITLFAPTNEAFEALPEGTLDKLLLPENQDLLRQVLTYHVIQEEVPAAQVTSGEVATAAGAPVSIQVDEATGEVMVNQARVVTADITASNGVIHAIDQVLLPPGLAL